MNLTPRHAQFIKDLSKEMLDAGHNPVKLETRLAQMFKEDESGTLDIAPEAVDKIEARLAEVGTMAANNLQGCEARRARAEGGAPVQYPPFDWTPAPGGTKDRLVGLIGGLDAIARSVVQAPPPPPVP